MRYGDGSWSRRLTFRVLPSYFRGVGTYFVAVIVIG
jgi:hypothetical protein